MDSLTIRQASHGRLRTHLFEIGIRNRLCRHPVRPARVPNVSRRESVHPNTRLPYLVPEPTRRMSLTVREIHCSRPESARQTEISWSPGSQMSSKKDCRLSPLTMDKGNPPWRRCVESPAFSDKRRTPLYASFPPPLMERLQADFNA